MNMARRSLRTGEGEIQFTITHRPRVTRRMHLELDDTGQLVVVVPRGWPDFYTRRLLQKNLPLVKRFLQRAKQQQQAPLRYSDGACHLFMGAPLTLRFAQGTGSRALRCRREQQTLWLCLPTRVMASEISAGQVREALTKWYLAQAKTHFARRLVCMQERAPWAQGRELALALRRMKRTWGTCNSAGLIRLNTHLIKAPADCLDYVIAHELCHLQEMNHGPRFYQLQESLWPDWRAYRQHLRDHGHRYTQE